jgi:hypothetical protein
MAIAVIVGLTFATVLTLVWCRCCTRWSTTSLTGGSTARSGVR